MLAVGDGNVNLEICAGRCCKTGDLPKTGFGALGLYADFDGETLGDCNALNVM